MSATGRNPSRSWLRRLTSLPLRGPRLRLKPPKPRSILKPWPICERVSNLATQRLKTYNNYANSSPVRLEVSVELAVEDSGEADLAALEEAILGLAVGVSVARLNPLRETR